VHPNLVKEVDERVRRDELASLLRALVEEGISIRDLSSILEELLIPRSRVNADSARCIVFAHGACSVATCPSPPAEDRLARVRAILKSQISHKYARGTGTLVVYLLDPHTETRMAQATPLDAAEQKQVIEAISKELGHLPLTAQTPVILTTDLVRWKLRQAI